MSLEVIHSEYRKQLYYSFVTNPPLSKKWKIHEKQQQPIYTYYLNLKIY